VSERFRVKNGGRSGAITGSGADDLLLEAGRYAARGWPVIPLWWPLRTGGCACGQPDCSNPGKHPLVRSGFHSATTDLDRIQRWWTRWPLANLGIRTGAASGLLVLDVDGVAGMESLRALRGEHGALRAAWVRTGSGGWHAYMRMPDDAPVRNSVGRLAPGLDVRGEGGSIVAPPSRHASGGSYRWLKLGVEPPDAPEWLIRLALPPPPPPNRPLAELRHAVSDGYAAAAIGREAQEVAAAPAGTRNHRLNLAAWRLGRLVAGGVMDEAVARDALLAAAAAAGLPHHESVATVRSGMTAGQRSPRQPQPFAAAVVEPTALNRGGQRHAPIR
jgi:hypothetical protein